MVYYTAITIKLNTKPWKQGGVTSREKYTQQLNYICHKYNCQQIGSMGWELDNCCQLHLHTTLKSNKALFRKNICSDYRKTYKKHNIWLVPISSIKNWDDYCSKTGNEEEKYHWLCRYYNNNYPNEFNNEEVIRNHERIKVDDIVLNKQNHWEKIQPEFID